MSSTAATSTHLAATESSYLSSASIDLAAIDHTVTQAATVALIVIGVVAFYLLTCLVWPFGKCRRCRGTGKFTSSFGNKYRHCGTCDGSGLRVRLGRHVINHIRATRAAGTNTTSKESRE